MRVSDPGRSTIHSTVCPIAALAVLVGENGISRFMPVVWFSMMKSALVAPAETAMPIINTG
jgi:hypothetical protein